MLVALAAVGQAQSTRQNRTQRLVYGFGIGVGCRLAGLAMTNVVTNNPKAVPLLYVLPIGASIISLILITTASQPWASRWFAERVAPRFQRAIAPLARLFARPAATAGG